MEVYILRVNYAPDWPSLGGWKIDGVYSSMLACEKRIDELTSDIYVVGYDYHVYTVKS